MFSANKKGFVNLEYLLGSVILLVVAVILIANVVMPTIKNANTTGWTSSETALWGLVSLAVIIGAVVLAFRAFGVIQ